MTGQVRQRRGGKKKRKTNQDAKPPTEEPTPPEEETMWQTLKGHPLVMVIPVVLVPYTLYLSFLYFQLQRPDIISAVTLGMIQLRPAISVTDERQMLIVGTMSSGTVQVASDLQETLKLEVGHETSDAEWSFVRDGTVSWFHGIRFLETSRDPKDMVLRWARLCTNYTKLMGFHPNMYKSSECSSRVEWSKCWSKQCLNVLRTEWGCAESTSCETPFRTTLLQLRHPLRTMESLVTKFCQGGLNGTIHPSFVTYASTLFPDHNYTEDNCIEATAYYVTEYDQAMIKAHKKGLIADIFRIEETTPCDVARMTGLMDPATTVYAPNHDRVVNLCDDSASAANQLMQSTKHKVNVGLLSLKWEDLRGGVHGSQRSKGDKTVERQIRDLTKTLGYDPNQPTGMLTEGGEFN